MAKDSADKWDYEARIARRFGFAQQFELPIPMPETKEAASRGGPFLLRLRLLLLLGDLLAGLWRLIDQRGSAVLIVLVG